MNASLIPLPVLFKSYSFVPLFGEMESNDGANFFQGNDAIAFSDPAKPRHLDAWKYANNAGHGIPSIGALKSKITRYFEDLQRQSAKSENTILFLVRNLMKLQILDADEFIAMQQMISYANPQMKDFRIIKKLV